uniref:WASH complex subunit FAM21 n=1 Tax=Wuchereria bancrofti TaxID=6293 RepID=A0A1I8EUE8_WUCBA
MLSSNLQILRDKKSNWSLADDRQLCGVLEEIRSSITSKINNVSDAIQENSLKVANAYVQVSNLNNRLSLFSADQFIENRVGDEASTCDDPAPTSQTIVASKQTDTTVNLRQAVSMGLELMQTNFKRIDIRPEDLDEDDDPLYMPEPIFEPYSTAVERCYTFCRRFYSPFHFLDENLTRPLPFLIGSPEWNSSSCAGSLEECARTAKVTEEIIISLPPFTQPKMAECKGLTYSNAIAGNLTCMISNRSTSNTEDVETKTDNYSNECRNETYQHVVTASSSQASLMKETEVENTLSDLSRNVTSRQYSEGLVTPRSPGASVGHQDSEVLSHKPPDLEVSARLTKPEVPIKGILNAATMKGQTKRITNEVYFCIKHCISLCGCKRVVLHVSFYMPFLTDLLKTENERYRLPAKSVSNAVGKLFVDSSSDEDDLFSDLKNTSTGAKRHISTYSNDTQIISISKLKKINLQTDVNVRSPDAFADASKPENSTDYVFVNNAKPSNVFRNKLDSIFSNKILSNTINGVEKHQGIQEKEVAEGRMNDRTSAVLPSIAKQRAKGPPRRAPSRLLQHSDKKDHNEKVVRSVRVEDASTEDGRNIVGKAEVRKERQDDQLKIDSGKYITKNMNSVEQKSDINSLFSSDSDDDIFSTFSGKSKTNAFVSKSNVRNGDVQSLLFSRERSSTSRIQALKSDFKNLFDSDDEDIFGSTISVKKHEQKPAKDKEAFLEKVIQEAVITKKDGSVLEKKEAVVPRKLGSSRPKRVDIFGDDSDGDLFSL